MTATTSPSSTLAGFRRPWRVIDIVTASVLGVSAGIIFWAWGLLWNIASIPLAILPGLSGVLAGGWLFAGVLGGLIVRKPGAALYTEIVAAVVSMLVGTQWGWGTLVSGIVQGLGAELVFAIFLYSTWKAWVAALAGTGAAVGLLINELLGYYAGMDSLFTTIYSVTVVLSGAVVAGLGSWQLSRALARTGALGRFTISQDARAKV